MFDAGRRVMKEVMNLIEAKEQREMDAAESEVTWTAASEARISKAETGPSGESGFGVKSEGFTEGDPSDRQSKLGLFASGRRVGGERCGGLARG